MDQTQPEPTIDGASQPVPRARSGWLPVLPDSTLEMVAVLLLSIASLGAAWAGYQASRWGGEQTHYYSQAAEVRVESTRASTIGYTMALGDLTVFNAWVEAIAEEDQDLADFHRRRFSPELETAVNAWLALDPLNDPDAPGAPFEGGLYGNPQMVAAEELAAEAEALFELGGVASERSDDYVLLTVIFAIVLFFGGISSRITTYGPKMLMLSVASLLLGYAGVALALLPIL